MAVSPNIFEKDERDESENMTTKAKALAVRTGSSDGLNGMKSQPKSTQAEPEIAEQMNLEAKKKYAKGLLYI